MINLKDIFLKKTIKVRKEIDHAEEVILNAEKKLKELKECHSIDLLRDELASVIDESKWAHRRFGLEVGSKLCSPYDERNSEKIESLNKEIDCILDEMVKVAKDK